MNCASAARVRGNRKGAMEMRSIFSIGVAAGLSLAAISTAHANLIQNGSFESFTAGSPGNFTDWTNNGDSTWIQDNTNPFVGSFDAAGICSSNATNCVRDIGGTLAAFGLSQTIT